MHYYSVFWGPRAISTSDDPRGAFTCPSSTPIVLANSAPFPELLLTVLGSRLDFHSCSTPRCTYVPVINTRSFGRFWPISWTITRFWGPESISTIAEPWGEFTYRSSTLTILADSCLFRPLLLSILRSQSDFHDCRSPGCVYVSVINTRSFG